MLDDLHDLLPRVRKLDEGPVRDALSELISSTFEGGTSATRIRLLIVVCESLLVMMEAEQRAFQDFDAYITNLNDAS